MGILNINVFEKLKNIQRNKDDNSREKKKRKMKMNYPDFRAVDAQNNMLNSQA